MFGITYFDYNFSDVNAANNAFNAMLDTLIEYNDAIYACKLLLESGVTAEELVNQLWFDEEDAKNGASRNRRRRQRLT